MARTGSELGTGTGMTGPSRPTSVGKYQLLAILGRGGMADVFLALSRGPMGFNKLVVVKRLRAALADDTQFRNMFLDEARLAARLNHPNVVHTYEVGAHQGVYFIAMEYLEGQSLNKIIKEALKREVEFEPVFCARIISDALAGLHHAHELKDYDGTPLKIIHRDVSPHNIFVTYDGSTKVVDFGIAKAAMSSVETEVGVLKGKVAYMSPEQAAGVPLDARADVFAMGIVLWELLSLERLMTGDSAASTLHRLMNASIPRVSAKRADVDPELDDIVARALEKDPNLRFQSAQEMRDALEGYIASTTHHSLRQDDIGRRVSALFKHVREEIQRQIQIHMEGVTEVPMSTGELATLTQDSALRIEQVPPGIPPGMSSGQLPVLSAGSGSGIVSNLAPPPYDFATMPPPPAPMMATHGGGDPNRAKGLVLWLLLAAVVGLIAVVAFGLRRDRTETTVVTANTGGSSFDDPSPGSPQSTTPGTPPVVALNLPGSPGDTSSIVAPPPTGRGGLHAPATPTHRPPAPSPPDHTVKPLPPVVPTAPAATATPTADDSNASAFLTFDSYPWTRVSEGGRVLGNTPIVHQAMTPGTHTLTLENADQGIKQNFTVTLKPGESVSKRLGLK